MKEAQKGVRMTDEEDSGLVESEPAPSQQVLRPTDAGLTNVDRLAESIAREIGYSGAAYALEVVHIQDWVYEQAKLGVLRLYREDKPFPFVFGGLLEFHGGLRLASLDAQKVRAEFLGESSAQLAHSSEPASASGAAERAPTAAPAPADTSSPQKHTHLMKNSRGDELAPLIRQAIENASDPTNYNSAWIEFKALALLPNPPRPLVGFTAGEGVKYEDDEAEYGVAIMTKEAFRGRHRTLMGKRGR